MSQTKIQQIFAHGWNDYCKKYQPSSEQSKAAYCIMNCKSGAFGYNIRLCEECNYLDFHANSCRNRNCPNCQAVLKELQKSHGTSPRQFPDGFRAWRSPGPANRRSWHASSGTCRFEQTRCSSSFRQCSQWLRSAGRPRQRRSPCTS